MTRTKRDDGLTVPLTLAVTPEQRGVLDAYAATNRVSVAELVRQGIDAYLGTVAADGVMGGGQIVAATPAPSVMLRLIREHRRRGTALSAAKRARQRN